MTGVSVMRVTINDIAKETGYASSTVSMVLNNRKGRITQETRRKILRTARQLGYVKHQVIKSRQNLIETTLGVIVPKINPFYGDIVNGIEETCRKNGWILLLANSHDDLQLQEGYIRSFHQGQVAGIVLTAFDDHHVEAGVQLCRQLSLPVVTVNYEADNCPSVLMDNVAGGYLVAHELLTHGHSRILYLAGNPEKESTKRRLVGIKNALVEAGDQFRAVDVIYGNYSYQNAFDHLSKINWDRYTAVLAFNDLMAYAVINYAHQHNIKIPDQLSIIGYDNRNADYMTMPQLSSVQQEEQLMGSYAADMIINRQDELNGTINVVLPPKLIRRKSVAEP